ncbi:hypothetical protein RclHR1_01630006 [Rhizophagus clarus]|uniref:Replication origin-binding protein domain-containing protein n=1 Tax=Rhizophagus clarus TaxID=94130 RepID=A0A2Z6RA31_9GLOM|nr:hypothetical protein RclHR1_01630006 [Rhizophagus clarus]
MVSACPLVAILDETNAILHQMSNGTNAQESENAMHNILKTAQHVLAMVAFRNESTLTFLKTYCGENIRMIDNKFQPFVEKASKLQRPDNSLVKACAYYGDMDRKQQKKDFSGINFTAWGELDCVVYTSAIEAGLSFEKANHFNVVIDITNIVTPVNVEAFVQMMF